MFPFSGFFFTETDLPLTFEKPPAWEEGEKQGVLAWKMSPKELTVDAVCISSFTRQRQHHPQSQQHPQGRHQPGGIKMTMTSPRKSDLLWFPHVQKPLWLYPSPGPRSFPRTNVRNDPYSWPLGWLIFLCLLFSHLLVENRWRGEWRQVLLRLKRASLWSFPRRIKLGTPEWVFRNFVQFLGDFWLVFLGCCWVLVRIC